VEKPRPWGERPSEGTIGRKRKVGVEERGKVLMGSGDALSLALMAQDEGREDANDVRTESAGNKQRLAGNSALGTDRV
jgi:hypothetical protein